MPHWGGDRGAHPPGQGERGYSFGDATRAYRFEVGRVLPSVAIPIRLTLRNSRQFALAVKSVSTSCHCTSAQIEASTIAPGSSVDLPVIIQAGDETGVQRVFVTIAAQATNVADRPRTLHVVSLSYRVASFDDNSPYDDESLSFDDRRRISRSYECEL